MGWKIRKNILTFCVIVSDKFFFFFFFAHGSIKYEWVFIIFIGMMVRVLTNGPGVQGSIPGPVILKTQKWYFMPPCLTLSIIRYGSRVKRNNQGKGVAPWPIPRCSSYWKGSLQVALDYDHLLYFYFLVHSLMWPSLPLWFGVNLGVMEMKDLQKWSRIVRCSLLALSKHPILEEFLKP